MRNTRIVSRVISLVLCACFGFFAQDVSASLTLQPDSSFSNQLRINSALSDESAREDGVLTVYLSAGVYTISDTIYLGSNTVLKGDKEAVIKLAKNAGWSSGKAMFKNKEGASNILLQSFQIDGNKFENSVPNCGTNSYDLISLNGASSIKIRDMYLYRSAGHILKMENSRNLQFSDNIIREQGDSALFIDLSENLKIYNNNLAVSCGSGIKIGKSGNVSVFNNIISPYSGTSGGIEIGEGGSGTLEIYGNKLYGLGSSAISCRYSTASKIHFHHNIIYNCNKGISVSRSIPDDSETVLIEFNTLDSLTGPAISIDSPNSPALVRNNIFSNSQAPVGSFVSQGNCFANTLGATPQDTSVKEAGFANPSSSDFHLKSKAGRWSGTAWITDTKNSPCLDKGTGILRGEPSPNGCKPNPGRYGNTTEASLSGEGAGIMMPSVPRQNSREYFYGDEIIYASDSDNEVQCIEISENMAQEENCIFGRFCGSIDETRRILIFAAISFVTIAFIFLVFLLISRHFFPDAYGQNFRFKRIIRYAVGISIIFIIVWILIGQYFIIN